MKQIFLDTDYIISFLVDDEINHERAVELSQQITDKELIITNILLIETINLLTKKLNKNTKAINEIYNSIKSDFKIIHVSKNITDRGMETLIHYDSHIGLADTITIEIMKDLNIHEIVSFDEDFDNKTGIIRVH
ncbi:MAG: PIN domain-containing protein [Methanobrevibacter sp.]|jgi:predicted nucleic acid-binding protein|nr:PIN domain-containing protein [Candidatus Methanovirga australis]